MKFVLYRKFGGFGLTWEMVVRLKELGHPLALGCGKGPSWMTSYLTDIPRTDPLLVQVVEEFGDRADGLKVFEYDFDPEKLIRETMYTFDGKESCPHLGV